MPSVFSYFTAGAAPRAVELEPAETHNLETSTDKTAKSALYLIKANHVNHPILYNKNKFHNHAAHILSSAYLLGATEDQLRAIYETESADLGAWTPSPAEVIDEDWMDFRGDKAYQRSFLDYFEDKLAMEYAYDWKKLVMEMLFAGKEPLFNGLVSGLAHPLIHLAYAFEMDSKDIAMEALAMACACYNYLHKYLDDPKYTKNSPLAPASLPELLKKLSTDARFDPVGDGSNFASTDSEFILTDYLEPILEYWNAWDMEDPTLQLKSVQQVSASILVGTESPHNKAYNFFFAHLLTGSHSMRVLIPLLPAEHHVNVLRQWWLLTLLIYIGKGRPVIDPGNIGTDTGGRDWSYVVDRALNAPYAKDAHYVKVIRSLQEAEKTWGDESQEFLLAAVTFVDNFEKWAY